MTFLYLPLRSTAAKLLADFGKSIILRNVSAGVYNPDTGLNTTTPNDSVRKGALFDFGAMEAMGPGGLVEAGDKKLLMEAGVVPSSEDKIVDGATIYTIVGIGETNPAGTPVMYTLHLRR